jgi:hypothetical protein
MPLGCFGNKCTALRGLIGIWWPLILDPCCQIVVNCQLMVSMSTTFIARSRIRAGGFGRIRIRTHPYNNIYLRPLLSTE